MAAPEAPLYGIGDVVYLRESANLGFLESVRIASVNRQTNEVWTYTVSLTGKLPASPLFGERITHQPERTLFFEESELLLECDALELAETHLITRLNDVQTRLAQCN